MSLFIRTVLVMQTGLTLANSAAHPPTAFLDQIRFGDRASERAHRLESTGNVRLETLATEMGSFHDRWSVRTLTGKGAQLSVQLRPPPSGRRLLLEIQEIHNRRPNAFGYTVLVNDREIYFRTYQEYGAGPNHYFIEVDPAGARTIRVTFRSEGGAPFSLGRLWAYDNFFEHVAEREQVYRPMGLIIPTEFMKTAEQRQRYAGLQCYAPIGRLSFNGYGLGGLTTDRKALGEKIQQSSELGIPSLILLNGTGWGGKPNGPDGLGGYFSDPRYSLIQYNTETGQFRPSWPGMWGSTPTPTLRDPWLNAFLERRFALTLASLPDQLAFLHASGKPAQPILIREFAPVSGEISTVTIENARRDGVTLDPQDGLDWNERQWMFRDAVRTWQEYADSTVRAVGRDAVWVDQGTVHLPGEQLLDNLYAHPDFLTEWPAGDPRWGGGQIGMVDGLWSSGEMGKGNEYRDIAMYDYLRARGKLAMINMERTILKEDFSVLKSHYQRGFQFLTLFNAYEGDEKYVKQVDAIDADPALPPAHREPTILDIRYARAASPGPREHVVAANNLRVYSELRLGVEDCARPGQVTYRLTNVGEPFTAPLNLHLNGRISPGHANRIEVHAGPSPDALRPVTVLTAKDLPNPDHWTPWMTSETTVDLGAAMVGQKEYYLRLVVHAAGAPDAALLISLHVGTQWPRRSGYITGTAFNTRQNRLTQLWVQDRALAVRWLGKYRELGGADATYRAAADWIDRGWYRTAHRLLSGEISQLLPARYAVRGHGRLGRHPVEVQLPGTNDVALVTLHKLGNAECELTVTSDVPVTVTLPGRPPATLTSHRYRLTRRGIEAQPVAPTQPTLPRTLVARCLQFRGHIVVDCQDLALMGYDESLSLPVAKTATRSRRADTPGAVATREAPQPLDKVELTLNEQGQVVDIQATYGVERARIRAFHPPVLIGKLSNGEIEMESGNRYALHYDKRTGTTFDTVALHAQVLNYEVPHLIAALKPGQEIEVTYCPYREKGGLPRLRTVKQPQKILLEQTYSASTGEDWKQQAVSVVGLAVTMHKPEPNYLTKVELPLLRPTQPFLPGEVVYRVEHDQPLATTAVEFTARAFEDSSRVEFFTSRDGQAWTKCGQFDNTWQNNISQQLKDLPWNFVDLTPTVQGTRAFFLKVRLTVNSADDRFCVGKLRVITEARP